MSEDITPSPGLGAEAGSGVAPSDVAPDPGSSGTLQPAAPTSLNRDALLQLIPEEIRSETVFQNINAENPVADMAAQFLHAQKLVGVDKIPAPKEDWTEEQWGSLYDRIGRPGSIDGYKVPDGDLPLDEKAINDFREIAHKNGLTAKQFEAVVEFHNQVYGSQTQQSEAQQKELIQKGLNELRQEWGDNFAANLQSADRFFSEIKDESLKELILSNEMLRNHPGIIRHFHQLSSEAREAAVRTGDSTNPAVIHSAEQAQAALKKFEEDNRDILFKRREAMNFSDKQRLEEVVSRRAELYKMAFPE